MRVTLCHNIQSRQATKNDEFRIATAWKKAYPDLFPYKYPERWKWLFVDNPFLPESLDHLPIWIAEDGKNICAWTAAMNVYLKIRDEIYPAAFSIDTYTLPQYRRMGLAQRLQSQSQKHHKIFLGISMSPANRRVKYNLGGKPGKPFYIYFKLLNKLHSKRLYDSAIQSIQQSSILQFSKSLQKIRNYGAQSLLGLLISSLLKIRQNRVPINLNHCYKPKNLIFHRVDFFDSEIDSFWNSCKNNYDIAVSRDSHYLNWKYVHQPHLHYHKYIVRQNDKTCGILIYRLGEPPEVSVGIISELIANEETPDIISPMLTFAQNELSRHGAAMIKCGSSLPVLSLCLKRAHFRQVRVNVPVIHIQGELTDDTTYNDILSGKWLMSLGDQDMDQFLVSDQPLFSHIIGSLINKITGTKDISRAVSN